MDIVRPDRNVIVGDGGFAASICASRARYGLTQPSLGEVKSACLAGDAARITEWLKEIRDLAASQLLERGDDGEAAAPTLVLPFDQAEELFNAEAAESSQQFLALLRNVLTESNADELGLVVAATIRTDRYEVLQTHPQLAGVGTELFDELKPMPPTQFKEVIVGPAHRATDGGHPLQIAPDLVDRLLADAGAGADTLPMLALTLARLYSDYGSTGELTLHHYDGMGGMRRVVHTEIDEILSRDPSVRADQLQALRRAFIPWLATVNPDTGAPMRRVARVADLPTASRPLIDSLVAKRLMVRDIRDGTAVVEVALESLLRQWDELAGWLRDERTDLRDADDLLRSADAWRSSNRNSAWLLEGTRLAEATALVNRPGFQEQLRGIDDYVNASHQRESQRRDAEEQRRMSELAAAQDREQAAQERAHHAQEQQAAAERHTATLRKRGHILRGVIAVTAVVAVVAVFGFVQANAAGNDAKRQFREATSQRLIVDAQAMLDGSQPGGDLRALQQMVTGQRLAQSPDPDALYDTAVATAGLDTLIELPSEVLGLAVSPDGRLIAAGGDGKIWFWDAQTGEMQGEPVEGHDGGVTNVLFSPDGSRLLSSGADSTVRVWDVATRQQNGEPLQVRGADGVRVLAVNPSGDRVALLDSDGAVSVWNYEERNRPHDVFPPGTGRIAISRPGDRIATADGSVIKIWDVNTGNQIGDDLTGHEGDVVALEFSPDGHQLASGGLDNTARLWNARAATPIGVPMTANSTEVVALAFPPDASYLAAGASDGSVRFYDTTTQAPLGLPLQTLDGFPQSLKIDPDGRRLVVGGSDRTVRIYDLGVVVAKTGQASAFSPDGSTMAVGDKDGVIRSWTRDSDESMEFDGRMGAVNRLVFLPDGERLLAADAKGAVQNWNSGTGHRSGPTMSVPDVGVMSLALSPSGEQVLAGYFDGSVRLWDVASGRLAHAEWRAGDGLVTAVGFIDEGRRIAALSVTSDAQLYVWDITGDDEAERRDLGPTIAVTFGADGRVLGGSIDGSVSFLTGIDGESIGNETIDGHDDAVSVVAFTPNGNRAATGARDGSVRLWDAETGTVIGRPLPGNPSGVVSLTFSADSGVLAVGGIDDTTQLWPATADIDDLCAKMTANMSRQQWNDWVSPDIEYVKGCPDLPVSES
jgi:WD40 repeat protein